MASRTFLSLIYLIFLQVSVLGQSTVTRQQSIAAAEVVGRWLTNVTGPADYYSATPVAPRRAGKKFFITKEPAKQYASDYGFSTHYAPVSNQVKSAYQVLGQDANSFASELQLNRVNLAFGIHNIYDVFLNYLYATGGISGFGVGYKKQIYNFGPLYLAYRFQYGQSKVQNYFTGQQFTTDFSASLYFRLVDIYAGIRHSFGRYNFETPIRPLQLPENDYFDQVEDLEAFYGLTLALTTGLRLSLIMANKRNSMDYGAKISFHFDSIVPYSKKPFRDPRYIKH